MLARSVHSEVGQAVQGLDRRGQVALDDPPHDEMRSLQRLEPGGFLLIETLVKRRPDELLELCRRFPDAQINEEERIRRGQNGVQVVRFVLEAPDEAREALGDCVHPVYVGLELGQTRAVNGIEHTTDIQLGQMVAGRLTHFDMQCSRAYAVTWPSVLLHHCCCCTSWPNVHNGC
jgi:hypothetical protein